MSDTNNQQVRLQDLAWLAGLWEGEGCFDMTTHGATKMYPRAAISNADFSLIEEIHAILTKYNVGHYIHWQKRSARNRKHKDVKVIYIVGMKRVKCLLEAILPYMRGENKKEAGRVMLEYVDRRLDLPGRPKLTSFDFAYQEQVRALNRKGPVENPRDYTPNTTCREDIVQVV